MGMVYLTQVNFFTGKLGSSKATAIVLNSKEELSPRKR